MGEAWNEGGHWIAFPDFGSGLVLRLSGMKGILCVNPTIEEVLREVGSGSGGSISFGSSWLVTGLVTVDGNR